MRKKQEEAVRIERDTGAGEPARRGPLGASKPLGDHLARELQRYFAGLTAHEQRELLTWLDQLAAWRERRLAEECRDASSWHGSQAKKLIVEPSR